MRRRTRALAVKVATAALAFLTLAPCAADAQDPTYKSATGSVEAGSSAAVRKGCAAGTFAIGGGVDVTGTNLGGEVRYSTPFDDGDPNRLPEDGWEAGVNAGADPEDVTVWAICAPEKTFYYRATRRVVKPGLMRSLEAPCDDNGITSLSGGVRVTGSKSTKVTLAETSSDPGWGWRGVITNGSNTKVRMTVWAVCGPSFEGGQTYASGDLVPHGTRSSDAEPCDGLGDPQQYLTGLGAFLGTSGPAPGTEIASLEPIDDDDLNLVPDDGVSASMNNQSGAPQVPEVNVVCGLLD